MKKFYAIILACMLCTANLFAQTYHWIGPSTGAGGNWNDANNWSPNGIPNGNGVNVIFDQNALVNVNIASISVSTISVADNITAKLFTSANTTISVSSTSTLTPGLSVGTNSLLVDSTAADVDFEFNFLTDAKGLINGTWSFKSAAVTFTNGVGPYFSVPTGKTRNNRIDVNGKITFGKNTTSFIDGSGEVYIFFNSGSEFDVDGDGGSIISAVYDANSTIRITGLITSGLSYSNGGKPLGNVIIDCPNITASNVSLAWYNIKIQGNLQVLNTNDKEVWLMGNGNTSFSTVRDTVAGNMTISGTSKVVISNVGQTHNQIFFYVNGDINMGGTRLDLQRNNNMGADSHTTLVVKGNLNHTAGTILCTGNDIDENQDLFVIEMAGTSPQTISSITGIFQNIEDAISLRMNNAAGVTLLTNLTVGKISFNSPNKGILTLNPGTILTINNPLNNANTVNSPANNGYVNGVVRRKTNETTAYSFPVGANGVLRSAEVIPSTTTASTYSVQYFNTGHSDPSVVPPLTGISNAEYWDIGRLSGSAAVVRLTLNGAVPGATATDRIIVAHYNGADWENAKGPNSSLPGDATSGSVVSAVMNTFSPFTFGIAPQAALPIILLSFDAQKLSGNNALVSWKVTGNSTPESFEVLRATDGKNFSSVGTVPANSTFNYSFTDNNLPTGTTYYKLKMIDRDGSVTYSKVAIVLNGSTRMMITSLAPTVVTTGIARVKVSTTVRGNLSLVITDLNGRIIQQYRSSIVPGTQEVLLNVMPLSKGTYQVTGYLDGERSATMRFIKQ